MLILQPSHYLTSTVQEAKVRSIVSDAKEAMKVISSLDELKAASMSEKINITKLHPCSAHRKPGSKSVSKEKCHCPMFDCITLPNNFSRTDVDNIKRGNFQ